MIPPIIRRTFPQYAEERWVEVALDQYAKELFTEEKFPENPLLDPKLFASWASNMPPMDEAEYWYGGYGENRSALWRGHYMLPHHPIHLGLDITVPSGAQVTATVQGRIVECGCDGDQEGGWGGRVVINTGSEFLIYAHLDPYSLPSKTNIVAGDLLGLVGNHRTNGGWFPHLHIQRIKTTNWRVFDGYGTIEDLKYCPNPLELVIT